jgi:hypothetical protein
VKATLRIFFGVIAVLFLSLSTFKIMASGCLILWLIDVIREDITQLSREAEPEVM